MTKELMPEQLTSNNLFKDLTRNLVDEISDLIGSARQKVAREYNSSHVLLCWYIGNRLNKEFVQKDRSEYGEQIIANLSYQLSAKYGKGYSRPNLFRMLKFVRIFPELEIVSTLSRQLSWSHFILICGIEDKIKRDFFVEMVRVQNWSVRYLKKQLGSSLFERTVISKKTDNIIKEHLSELKSTDQMSTDLIFKDPYFINFIKAEDCSSELDLESAILTNITGFLQELGSDFCFIARQKRMSIGTKDRYLDLLFFHRRLRRLIALDLKLGSFDPAHKGQMEWYLNWLDKNERLPQEEKPLGIILCSNKDQEDIEYLEMDKSGIHVARYLTDLPPRNILESKLKEAIKIARENQAKLLLDKK